MGWTDSNGKGGKSQDYSSNGQGSGGFMWTKLKELTDFTTEIQKKKKDDEKKQREFKETVLAVQKDLGSKLKGLFKGFGSSRKGGGSSSNSGGGWEFTKAMRKLSRKKRLGRIG